MSDDLVTRLLEGRDAGRQSAPPSEGRRLTVEEAYEVQDRLRAALVGRGAQVVGWKVGFTSAAVQQTFGAEEPVSAFLLASGVRGSGAEVPCARLASPAVEAEIALLLRADLAGPGVTAPRALLAVEGALPALEIIDFRFRGRPHATDVIADGVYASAIVLGGAVTPLAGIDLALEGLVYEHGGAVVATATAAEVLGHPLQSLAWLANHLATRGLALRAGDVVMTGSISRVLPVKAGDTVRASFTRLGAVAVRFT